MPEKKKLKQTKKSTAKAKPKTAKPKKQTKKPVAKKVAPKKSADKKQVKTGNEDVSQRIRIKIKAYDHKIVDLTALKIVETAKRNGADISGPVPLPTEKNKYTVIKSPFVHKDSREQYEMRIHKRLIDISNPTPKTVDSLTNLNLPAGVDIEIKM